MATEFSFEEGLGPTDSGDTFVAADRTSKKKVTSSRITSDKRGSLPKDKGIFDAIRAAAKEYGVPEEYGFALAQQESDYNPAAHNDEFGADGMFQYIPATAKAKGLKYGVDTRDPVKAAKAAMQDFAAAMATGGIDWAIKSHFAGPDESGHGPKTQQYLADVQQRADDIRQALANGTNPAAVAGMGGSSDAGPKQAVGEEFSFEDGLGTSAPAVAAKPTPKDDTSITGFLKDQFADGHILDALKPAGKTLAQGFDFVVKRLQDGPNQYLGQEYKTVERTPAEIETIIRNTPDYAKPVIGRAEWEERQRKELRFKKVLPQSAEAESADIVKRNTPDAPQGKGFLANIENPLTLLTSDSLPANVAETLANLPENDRKKFFDARKVAQQENIVANPDKFPAVSVQAAQQAIDERKAKQDPGIREMWMHLKEAAKEDPGRFSAQFANALMADPEMLLAPEGVGLKVVEGTKKLAGAAKAASRITRLADKIVDAGSTGAAINLGIEAASASSEGRQMTHEEAAFTAAMGAGLSATFGAVFAKGEGARARVRKGQVTPDDLDGIMRDVAQEDIMKEELVNAPKTDIVYDMDGRPLPADARQRIERILGIEKMSPEERKAWHKKQQAELSKTFKDQWDEADYLKYKAEERMSRAQTLAEDAEAKSRQAAIDRGREEAINQIFAERGARRSARLQSEYEQALAAREANAQGDLETLAAHEDKLRDATKKLDQEDLISAAFESDKAVDQAMRRAVARDQKLRVPKWQRGDVDPRVLARLGLGSLFAGTAYAVADPEYKTGAAFAAGLAGLIIPGGGGNVLRRMRQAGAISADGDIMSLLIREGKLKPDIDAGQAKLIEDEQIARALKGDQQGYKELFEEHYPRVVRQARRWVSKIGHRTGVDAEDVAQEAFVAAFQYLHAKKPETNFGAWVHSLTKKKAIDALRDAQTLKGGADINFTTTEAPDVRDQFGETYSQDIFDKGENKNLPDWDSQAAHTPESEAVRQQTEQVLIDAIKTLPERDQLVFLLHRAEQYDTQEIAKMTGLSHDNVRQILSRSQEKVEKAIARGFNATKKVDVPQSPEGELVKRGRGRPRKIQAQTGEIDSRLLKLGAVAALGAGAGMYLNEQNKYLGAGIGAATALMFTARNPKGKSLFRNLMDNVDYTTGMTSTRIMNKSMSLWRRAVEHERIVLKNTHKHLKAGDAFLLRMKKLPKETQDLLERAILTGKGEVTNRLLAKIGDKALIDGWKEIRASLDSLGDQLVELKRFKRTDIDYFPRDVKDVEGLLKALGKERGSYLEEAIKKADAQAIAARGTGLTDVEKSMLINKVMKEDQFASQQPGFAKFRGVEEITPELHQFYASALESYHSYVRSAVEDIERAKFFGKDLEVVTKGKQEYTNVGESVGTLTNRLMNEGKLSPKDAEEVAGMLRSRFLNGEKAPNELIQGAKNLSYAGLLGNVFSSAVQLGDVVMQTYTQGLRPTLEAVARKLTGNSKVNVRDFGLADHIAEEFVSTTRSAKFVREVFKYSLFKGIDMFGKDIGLNAAILKAGRLAKSEGGIRQLAAKWQEALGPTEFQQLVKDLQKGEVTDLVESIAFAELSRSQPISRLELPQAYLDHPNGRLLYQFKSFMLKQVDMYRRDAYNEIKAGRTAKGLHNLVKLSVVLGLAGTGTQKIKDWMLGREVKFEASDIPINMFKTFGLTQYMADHFFGVSKEDAARARELDENSKARKTEAKPIQTAAELVLPPAEMFDQIVTADPKAIRYIPLIGPRLYEKYKAKKALEQAEGGSE